MPSIRGVAWAWVAAKLYSRRGVVVVAVVIARVVPRVLVGFVGIRNEDIIDAIAVEVALDGAG